MAGTASIARTDVRPALRVVSGLATQHVLQSLSPDIERRSGRLLDLSFAIVARGAADVGHCPKSEVRAVAGTTIGGLLPLELHSDCIST